MRNGKSKQNKYARPSSGSSYTARPREKGLEKSKTRPIHQADSFLDELKNDLMAFFQINDDRAFTQDELLEHFGVHDRRMKLIMHGLVGELAEEGSIVRQPNGSYRADADANLIEGVVDHVNSRFAFVLPATADGSRGDRDDDIWVSTDDLAGAVDGDRVRVIRFTDSRNRGRRIEGKVVSIIERGRTELVGRIEVWPTYGFVSPDSKKIYEDIFIPNDKLGGAKNGEKVIVRLTKYPDTDSHKQQFEGEVITVLGVAGQNNTEMHAILAEFGLPIVFPVEVEQEAESIPTQIQEDEIAKRRDMREVTTFTIDPVDAKDFDDALSVKVLDNGNYEIGVHIADVTYYVRPGSKLEAEAYKRATSVYLVDRVVPMLPEKLSNGLCSLRPNEDKLTFSAVFELTPDAKIKNEWFGRTVTHSDRRFAYEEAQEILNNDRGDFLEELRLLNELAYKLRDERFKNGAINFETVEVRFRLDENGVPLAVYPKIRQDTNKLIEEFMLLANKRVAEYVHSLSKRNKNGEENTMVYRVHEGPDEDKLKVFSDFARRLGYKLAVDEDHLSASMNRFMESIEGRPEAGMLQQLAVRTMSKARYSTEDIGHFGLAFRRYSHFTSPIRRYPDMMAHRLLQHYLDKGKPADREEYEEKCRHSSERERMAAEAERASIKYKQVEFMSRMDPDQVFEGVISGVTEFGIFVEITENSCEGLVRMQDLNDDYYEFDKDNYRIVGVRHKKIYTFGDPVVIRVKETNLARRSMDFALVNHKSDRGTEGEGRFDARARESSRSSGSGRSRSTEKPAIKAKRKEGTAAKGQNRRGGRGRR
ncbi:MULTISPECIES: ribonuclease R [unclassified Spirosoma]|uniref:ribonuclease R n=1 Tax=unclassified Spirosoma TaxID=2621999 RepID=UPI00095FBAA5|nr:MULTISPECIES: ribonuclease R [unclassified Spirosoma]MBN8824746.1 ribonuclease R [Spirosoma sp.]OJW77097.1 MAG: ribonuclease R [Spirosoma sp. 48-14]